MGWSSGRRRHPGRVPVAAAVAAATTILLSGCALVGGPRTFQADVPDILTVTSPDVALSGPGQGVLGRDATCHGTGKAPALHWTGAPTGTKSFAIVADDAAAPIHPFIYWIVFDIGPEQTVMQTGQIPPGARQAQNSGSTVGYDPPCPTNASQSYRFTVYALGKWLKNLKTGASVKSAWMQIAGAAIARGRLTVKGSE